jgi:GNAT superfamily N-acetyltransferase
MVVRPFLPQDQAAARELIVSGLAAHFGFRDETLNRDLDDIAATFADGAFFVASIEGVVVGTGGLHVQADGTANVVRMSTAHECRRGGVGGAVLSRLIEEARSRGCHRVTLATNAGWDDAIAFYRACGFEELLRTEAGVVFGLPL